MDGIHEDKLALAFREIEAVPELVGLAVGIGEPVRFDPVAENQGGRVGMHLLGAGTGNGGNGECDNDELLTEWQHNVLLEKSGNYVELFFRK